MTQSTIPEVPRAALLLLFSCLLRAEIPNEAWKKHTIATGYPNWTAIAADFTGDGLPDVVSNDYKRTILYVAPKWQPIVIHKGPVQGIHSAVIDMDRDGDPDLVMAQYSPGLLFWLERPPNPMRDPWPYHLIDSIDQGGADGIHGILAGDINGDGWIDLAASSGQPNGPYANSVVWYEVQKFQNKPTNSLKTLRHVAGWGSAPGLIHYVGIGDVDGDGKADLATGAKFPPYGNYFAWWRQPDTPGGQWQKQVVAQNQEGATNILMCDVNRDGRMDFVASRGHGFGVSWFEAPSWTEHVIDADIAGPHSLAVGDINGDGIPDAATCGKNSMNVRWYQNDGKGNFRIHEVAREQAAYDIRLFDMDNDGDLDILIAGQESANVAWYENPRQRR